MSWVELEKLLIFLNKFLNNKTLQNPLQNFFLLFLWWIFLAQLRHRHQLHPGIKNNFIVAVLHQPNQQNHLSQFTSELCSCRNNFSTRAYAEQRMDTSLWVSFEAAAFYMYANVIKWKFSARRISSFAASSLALYLDTIQRPLMNPAGERICV
jgi:hypothetical protein